ncbi:MAG: NAD(P)-dependent oxidoreductase [Gammaproteobacteria bacterium]|jgi:3-hydroxyisobutyrate dehydrogenase
MVNKLTVGWIGTGVMGAPMCGHLMAAGYPVNVTSRTRSKADTLVEQGASWYATPAEVAAHSDIVFTMVGKPDEVRAVYFGKQGVFAGLQADAIVVDMGTTPPSLAKEITEHALTMNAHAVDAPVSGGDVGARNATLSIMAGGEEDVVNTVRPLFDCMAKTVAWMGAAGNGQHTKMANQLAVAGTMIGVCEALVYAGHAGVDLEKLVAVISRGAAGCWTLDNLAPRIINGDDAPGFMVDHFVKDLGIALSECEQMGLSLPGLELANSLYRELQAIGHGQSGTQTLVHAINQLPR